MIWQSLSMPIAIAIANSIPSMCICMSMSKSIIVSIGIITTTITATTSRSSRSSTVAVVAVTTICITTTAAITITNGRPPSSSRASFFASTSSDRLQSPEPRPPRIARPLRIEMPELVQSHPSASPYCASMQQPPLLLRHSLQHISPRRLQTEPARHALVTVQSSAPQPGVARTKPPLWSTVSTASTSATSVCHTPETCGSQAAAHGNGVPGFVLDWMVKQMGIARLPPSRTLRLSRSSLRRSYCALSDTCHGPPRVPSLSNGERNTASQTNMEKAALSWEDRGTLRTANNKPPTRTHHLSQYLRLRPLPSISTIEYRQSHPGRRIVLSDHNPVGIYYTPRHRVAAAPLCVATATHAQSTPHHGTHTHTYNGGRETGSGPLAGPSPLPAALVAASRAPSHVIPIRSEIARLSPVLIHGPRSTPSQIPAPQTESFLDKFHAQSRVSASRSMDKLRLRAFHLHQPSSRTAVHFVGPLDHSETRRPTRR
ncbi:hypothetical protein CPLU01_11337 [Colletotrichum plurivorum]|uniref:Uncharacterized protein n=1 Tax=Colletotrichum plurivorum TaxID=2175906 RepID=A0A8H6K290_9PEZI|nr:hypothetical protein CPLU01_11337 [Colletotrichum plurivorum]